MGLKFRRGTTAQKSGSLAFGEPYVNTTLGTLQIGGPDGDITLGSTGTGSTGNFGAISGSGLDITGNANIAGNLTLGGKLTIGDATTDTVNVVASLSSSLIPSVTNAFDLGSDTHFWRDLYVSTGSIKFVGAAGTVVGTLTNVGNGLNLDGGIVTNGNSSFGTSSLSTTSVTGSLRVSGSLTTIGTVKFDRDILIGSSVNDYQKITVGFGAGTFAQHQATNLAVGAQNLGSLIPDINTSKGVFNTAVGNGGLLSVTSGSFNTTLGALAGASMAAGVEHNTAVGYSAGKFIQGISNTYIGSNAGSESNLASANIGIGYIALSTNRLNASSQHNIGIGFVAGNYLDGASSNNIIIGREAGPQAVTDESNKLYIGHSGYPLLTGSLAEGALSLTINGTTQVSGAVKATSFSGQILANNGVLSGSLVSQLPAGVISGSSQVTISDTTGFSAYSTSVDSRILTEKGRVDAILSAADADKDSFAEIVTLINSVDTTNDNAFASFYTASVGRLGNLESFTSSINTTIKSKLDTDGVVSGSSQVIGILSSLNTYTGSNDTTNTTQNSRLDQLSTASGSAISRLSALEVETANLESFTSSINTTIKSKLDADGVISGSSQLTTTFDARYLNTGADGVVSGSSQIAHDSTTGYVANRHIDHTAVTITAGSGLSGGGDISTTRTLSIATGGVTNAMLEGSIANNKLANSTISGIALGSNLATLTIGTGLSGTSYNGSTGVTIANTGVTSNVAGTGVSVSGATGAVTISIGQSVATSANAQFNSLGIGMAASATAGRIDATNDVVAFSSSDIRFKENIVPIENALDKISKISGNTYDWKEENKIEHGYEGNDVGVIAQEIEAVLPQLVQTRENGFKAVKYDKLVALLIQGIKEQQIQIEELKAKIGL